MEVLDGQRIVTNKEEVIDKWRNDFAALLNANSSIPHSCTTESEKVCEAEMPPQLSELISPEVSEGSWEVIVRHVHKFNGYDIAALASDGSI